MSTLENMEEAMKLVLKEKTNGNGDKSIILDIDPKELVVEKTLPRSRDNDRGWKWAIVMMAVASVIANITTYF